MELKGGYSFKYPGIDRNLFIPSAILSSAYATGSAGEVTINTSRLDIQGGAAISTSAPGEYKATFNQYIPATGQGGNLTVNATDSIEVSGYNGKTASSLLTSTEGTGNAGNLELNTQQLIVRDRAEVNLSSKVANNFIYSSSDANNLGSAGALKVQARSIILDNQGKLISEADSGRGGNINLLLSDLLLMRRGSQISASAGKLDTPGDGGNITIDTPTGFIVAPLRENNDITANAFSGSGGKVQINAISIFGVAPRSREDLARQLGVNGTNPSLLDPSRLSTSDITAISQENATLNGAVNINTLDNNINRIPITLPTQPLVSKVVTSCRPDVVRGQSQFVITGRGGLPATPIDPIRSNTTVEPDWVSVQRNNSRDSEDFTNVRTPEINVGSGKSYPKEIVEAQGLVRSSKGDLYLVANMPVTTNYNPWFRSFECVVPN
ncbi:filamentous hemagglutinin outer membrane protein (plasmid) [Calothrix sp. NIES-4071]|nr:filamentous hemagglutinin outer membrane protein [Calothrix sp. NIES-4071]BAZ64791.1 filamentous hemagglutinin outer membrane protein [Calothrix sp. NIES-4105]